MNLIGIGGKLKHGKDSLAQTFITKFDFTRLSLADPLKHILAYALESRFELDKFYDQDFKDRHVGEWTKYDNIIFTTNEMSRLLEKFNEYYPLTEQNRSDVLEWLIYNEFPTLRVLMQQFGSDLARDKIDTNIWVNVAMKYIQNSDKKYVISDVRFKSERDMVRNLGGKLLLVIRHLPESDSTHASENDLGDPSEYDDTILNAYDLKYLEDVATKWYLKNK